MSNTDKPKIGEFWNDKPLLITPFPNGGYTVQQGGGEMMRGAELGAYSNAQDMLDALANALISEPQS